MKQLILILCLLLSITVFSQEVQKRDTLKHYRYAIGMLGSYKTVGLQSEVKILKNLGIRLAGTRIRGYYRPKEFGLAGIGLITYYIPVNNQSIEPVVGLGGVFSLYNWNMDFDKGTLHDFNIGGGAGFSIRFSDKFRGGINVFAVNSFRADYNYLSNTMEITGRKFLLFPILTFDYLF